MTLYPYALVIHIVGVLGLFISISLEVLAVFRMRAAKTTDQVHEWISVNRLLEKTLPASAVLILVSGLYLAFTGWGFNQAWIDLSLGGLVLLGILGPVINGSRMKGIERAAAAAPDGEIPVNLRERIADPVLRIYAPIPGILGLGVVALMTLKLDWIGSIAVLLIALVVGLIAGLFSQGTSYKAPSVAREMQRIS